MTLKLNEPSSIKAGFPASWPIPYSPEPGVLPSRRALSIQQGAYGSSPIRLLLVSSDPVSRLLIRDMIIAQTDFQLIAEIEYEHDAIEKASALRPDVVLIDVETLGPPRFDDGWLLSLSFRPIIVFLTRNRGFAIEAFDLGAVDYLLKPFGEERFEKTLHRVRQHLRYRQDVPHEPRKRITVTDRRKTHLIEPDQIEWISAAGDYTELHVNGATHLLREPFSALLGRLPADVFCRIHRSFAVNLNRISGFKTLRNQDLLVRLKDKTILRASRTFSEDFLQAIAQQCA